jgi:CSLREA domain-containing protein
MWVVDPGPRSRPRRALRVAVTLAALAFPPPGQALVALGSADTPGSATEIAVVDGIAYVADGSAGLRLYDVSDPAAPALLGSLDTDAAGDVAVVGNRAFVADGSSGLRVVDVSDPSSPREITGLGATGPAHQVEIEDGLVYVLDAGFGLRVFDPMTLAPVGALAVVDSPAYLTVAGGVAYVADRSIGLRLLDVSDPAAPEAVGFLYLSVLDVEVAGTLAYLGESGVSGSVGLRIFDVSDPSDPDEVGTFETGGAADVEIVGDLAYLASRGLRVVDVSNPAAPVGLGSLLLASGPLEVADGVAYTAAGSAGLLVTDVSEPTRPARLGSLPVAGWDVEVAGDHAYAAGLSGGVHGLHIFDVSDPAMPRVGFVEIFFGEEIRDVEVAGSFAYLGVYNSGLHVIDVSDPRDPVQVGWFQDFGPFGEVGVDGGIACASGIAGMHVIDVSNPYAPSELALFPLHPERVEDVEIQDGLAYAADTTRLRVIDLSNPAAPFEFGALDGAFQDLEVRGSLVYASSGTALHVIDVSDPTAPRRIALLAVEGQFTSALELAGPFAYLLVSPSNGLRIHRIDVSRPASPRRTVSIATSGSDEFAVRGTELYVAERHGPLDVLDLGPEYVAPPPTTFLVDSTLDAPDPVPGDGVCGFPCTLRAAVSEANASPGRAILRLLPGVYALASGALLLGDDLRVEGLGTAASETVIDGTQRDRIFEIGEDVTVEIAHVTLQHGAALVEGGAIASAGSLSIADSRLVGNRSGAFGGAVSSRGALTLTRVEVAGNTSLGGGGIHVEEGPLAVYQSHFAGNEAAAADGGAIASHGRVVVRGGSLRGNSADGGSGGGIQSTGGLVVANARIEGNSAAAGGGLSNAGEARLVGVTLARNTASERGGAVENGAAMTITNATLSGNASAFGGGITNLEDGYELRLHHVTVTANQASVEGGGICNQGQTLVTNTIVAGNGGDDCGCAVPLNSFGFNLDGDATCGLDSFGDLPGVGDAGLGPLLANGGPTPTHALEAGSPAIEAGGDDPFLFECERTDQRGISRPRDGDGDGDPRCDIGAFEFVPEPGSLALYLVALAAVQFCAAMNSRRTPGASAWPGSAISRRPASMP